MFLVGGYSRQMFPRAVVGSVIDSDGGFGVCFCLCAGGNGRDGKNIGQIRERQQNDKLQNIIQSKAIRDLNKPLIKNFLLLGILLWVGLS